MPPSGGKTPQVDIPGPKSRRWGGVPHRRLGMTAWTHLANGEGSCPPLCTTAHGGRGSKGRAVNGDRPIGAARCRREQYTKGVMPTPPPPPASPEALCQPPPPPHMAQQCPALAPLDPTPIIRRAARETQSSSRSWWTTGWTSTPGTTGRPVSTAWPWMVRPCVWPRGRKLPVKGSPQIPQCDVHLYSSARYPTTLSIRTSPLLGRHGLTEKWRSLGDL